MRATAPRRFIHSLPLVIARHPPKQLPHRLASEIAPSGTLRVGLNLRNELLITGRSDSGDATGLAPSMAWAFAQKLGCPLQFVPYDSPGDLTASASKDEWDIALIGADPAREAHVSFTAPYCEIEATYAVPKESPFTSCKEVDAEGVRIAVCDKAAYDLWLQRNIKKASVSRFEGHEKTYDEFKAQNFDALAGLRSKLTADAERLANTRLLPDKFMAVEQAICIKKGRERGFDLLSEFVEEAKVSGQVRMLIYKFGLNQKLSVAPMASKAT